MKRVVLIIALSALALSAFASSPSADETSFRAADWHWKSLRKGAEYGSASIELFGSVQTISVLRYPAKKFRTGIVNDGGSCADSTSALVSSVRGAAGINAGYFNVKTLYPTTYVLDDRKQEGKTTARELSRVDGLMTISGGHRIGISFCDTLGYAKAVKGCREAIASGPVLLLNGEYASDKWPSTKFYTGHHPRTFIGTASDGWVYMVVIDGRFKGQAEGMTILETATVAKWLGLKDALNLDGGGSCSLWVSGEGVISHPYDNKKFDHNGQRIVPNAIYIK